MMAAGITVPTLTSEQGISPSSRSLNDEAANDSSCRFWIDKWFSTPKRNSISMFLRDETALLWPDLQGFRKAIANSQ